jgi:hypothetical protein
MWHKTLKYLADIENDWRFVEIISGYLGLSTSGTLPGDIMVVLNQRDVPVVLRKSPNENCYGFIGTIFVVGLMDGEAVEFTKDGQSQPQWFGLR